MINRLQRAIKLGRGVFRGHVLRAACGLMASPDGFAHEGGTGFRLDFFAAAVPIQGKKVAAAGRAGPAAAGGIEEFC